MSKLIEKDRLLFKLASADELQGVDGAQKLSVHEALDASSTGATQQFAAEVEFQKKSEEERYTELLELALNHARHGETEELRLMIEHGLPVNLANHEGNSLLMLAAYNDQPETLQMLLECGAEPDRRNDRGQTPLGGVAFKGYISITKMLLDAGADPLADQGMNMTPLSFAKTFGRIEIERLLEAHISKSVT